MKRDWEIIKERLAERLKAVGMTERAASIMATGQPDAIRFMRTREVMPSGDRLSRIALVLQCTPGYLLGLGNDNAFEEIMQTLKDQRAEPLPPLPEHADLDSRFPIFSTFQILLRGSKDIDPDPDGAEVVLLGPDEPLFTLRVPLTMLHKKGLYGFYMAGVSMEPVFDSGELLLADPSRPASVRDYVIAHLGPIEPVEEDGQPLRGYEDAPQPELALVRRLIRQASEHWELEQFNPPRTIRVPKDRVKAMHRLVPLGEVLGDVR